TPEDMLREHKLDSSGSDSDDEPEAKTPTRGTKRSCESASDTPPKKMGKMDTALAVKSIMRESGQLEIQELLTHAKVEELKLRLSDALQEKAGAATKELFRLAAFTRGSYYPEDGNLVDYRFKPNDRIIIELRETAELVDRLCTGRGSAKGGLTMKEIVNLHAKRAMTLAWGILATMATATFSPLTEPLDTWTEVVRDTRQYLWHARRVLGPEFHSLMRLRSWLTDAEGPRISEESLADRMRSLREKIFPTGDAELQDNESYEIFGLADIDEDDFEAWEQNTKSARSTRASSPSMLLPERRQFGHPDIRNDPKFTTLEKWAEEQRAPSHNPLLDQMVQTLVADEERTRASASSYFNL
ncbi:unnamed protein product, partial [Oikopleura dioica]